MIEEIIHVIARFFTNAVQIILFLFSCVFYREWTFANKKLEKMNINYVDLITSQTESNNKLAKSLTEINHTISLLVATIK